jgi:hypothetical protein
LPQPAHKPVAPQKLFDPSRSLWTSEHF